MSLSVSRFSMASTAKVTGVDNNAIYYEVSPTIVSNLFTCWLLQKDLV